MVCKKLPAPNKLTEEKVEKLMCSQTHSLETLPPQSQALKQAFLDCSSLAEVPVIVFISKMFPVSFRKKFLHFKYTFLNQLYVHVI